MNSPPNAHILSTCFWIFFGDRSDAARFSRNGRNRLSNCSPGGRSFSNPIHERGQPLRSALNDRAEEPVKSPSGGMKRRLNMAAASSPIPGLFRNAGPHRYVDGG